MTRTRYQETALMRKRISTLALMAALVAVAFVSLPSEVLAQYGHHYGHGYGKGTSRIHTDRAPLRRWTLGPRNRRSDSNDGNIRIEIDPKFLRDEAQVYVNEAYVGDVDDFDGFFQRLTLPPGEYNIEVRLDGYQALNTRAFVRRGDTYKIRESLKPIGTN